MNDENDRDIRISGFSDAFTQEASPVLSVLLPTYKRLDALKKTLSGLEVQGVAIEDYEIIVIDDGSKDDTETFLKQFSKQTHHRFYFASLAENGGPARARNTGLQFCNGRVILIIGDDIVPETTLLTEHLDFHDTHADESYALLGHVYFPEVLKPNAFMRWLESGGRKYFFNYADLTPGEKVSPLFFYTCNVSIKASLLQKSGWFDESFRYASHEDLELGYRLEDQGMQLVYNDKARGAHWHMLSIQGITRRVYLMGYSAALFWQKVKDESGWVKKKIRRLLTWASTTPPGVFIWDRLCKKEYEDRENYPMHWHVLLFLSFFIGLSDSLNKRPIRV